MSSSLSRAKTTPENDTTNVTIPTTTLFFAPSFRSSALASLCLSLSVCLSLSLSLSLFCVGFYISTPELRLLLLMKEKRSPQREREKRENEKTFVLVLYLGFQIISSFFFFVDHFRFSLYTFCVPNSVKVSFVGVALLQKHATKALLKDDRLKEKQQQQQY